MCKLLLDAGADVDAAQAGTGWTALMQAAHNGYLSVVQVLVEKQCQLLMVNELDMTATEIAADAAQTAVKKYLVKRTGTKVEKRRKILDIFEATKQGEYQVVRELLDDNPDLVNLRADHSATALMFAAMRGHLAIAELLVDRDAELDWQDDISQWTALMNATCAFIPPLAPPVLLQVPTQTAPSNMSGTNKRLWIHRTAGTMGISRL